MNLIKKEFGIEAEYQKGRPGGFAVVVNGKVVARKGIIRFPSDEQVIDAVRHALGGS